MSTTTWEFQDRSFKGLVDHLTNDENIKEVEELKKWTVVRGSTEITSAALLFRNLGLLYGFLYKNITSCTTCTTTTASIERLKGIPPLEAIDSFDDALHTLERLVRALKAFAPNGSLDSKVLDAILGQKEVSVMKDLVKTQGLVATIDKSFIPFLSWMENYSREVGSHTEPLAGFCTNHSQLIYQVTILGNKGFGWKEAIIKLSTHLKQGEPMNQWTQSLTVTCAEAGKMFTEFIDGWKKEHGVKDEAKSDSGSHRFMQKLGIKRKGKKGDGEASGQ